MVCKVDPFEIKNRKNMNKKISLMYMVHEDYEAELAFKVLKKIKQQEKDVMCAILITDHWHLSNKDYLNRLYFLSRENDIHVYTLNKLFEGWQHTKGVDLSLLKRVLAENGLSIDLKKAFNAEMLFYPYERTPYYKSIPEKIQYKIALDLIIFIQELLLVNNITHLFSVNNQNMVKYLAHRIAISKHLKSSTLIHSRFGNNWYLHDNFGLGNSFKNNITPINNQVEDDVLRYKEIKNSLYEGRNYNLWKKSSIIKIRILDLFYNFLLVFLRREPINCKYYTYCTLKVLLFKTLCIIRLIKTSIFDLPYSTSNLDTIKSYFLYPLHQRPESSLSILSATSLEENNIEFIAERLPIGMSLLVKENPNMLDIRRRSFYKKIARIPNVLLVSNIFDSASLIQKSNGVISSSGTALLEAELLNIPGLCLGEAEFKDYISHKGFDSVSNFMNLYEQGIEKYTSRVNQYIEFLKKYSIQIGLFRSYTTIDLDTSEIVKLANAIKAFLGLK